MLVLGFILGFIIGAIAGMVVEDLHDVIGLRNRRRKDEDS